MGISFERTAEMIRDLELRDIPFRTEVEASAWSKVRAGGTLAVVAEPESYLSLKELSALLQEKDYPFFVAGAMSNTLVTDEGFPLAISTRRMKGTEIIGERVYVGSGEPLQSLVRKTAHAGLKGLEFLTGIPASVGGAAFMNAGCFGHEISECIESVSIFDFDLLRGGSLDRDQMDFSYRNSGLLRDRELILGVEFRLTKDLAERIKARMEEYRSVRLESQPQEPSLGSTFLKENGTSAGYYIDKAGLKGASVGGFRVSEKHAGFLVNTGGGSAEDYLRLIERVKARVFEAFGVRLREEIRIV